MKIISSIAFLFFLTFSAYTQEGSFSVQVSKDTVLLGNKIKIDFVLKNIEGDFNAPDLLALNVISGPNMASSMQFINGRTSQSTTYSYYVLPQDLGAYLIHPALLKTENGNLETEMREIIIIPNPDGIIEKEKSQDSFFDFPGFNFEFSYPDFLEEKAPEEKKDTIPGRVLKRI